MNQVNDQIATLKREARNRECYITWLEEKCITLEYKLEEERAKREGRFIDLTKLTLGDLISVEC